MQAFKQIKLANDLTKL